MNAVVKPSRQQPTPRVPACGPGAASIKFEALWDAYHGGHPSQAKDAKGDLLYKDQCAIKVSVALHAVGVDMHSFTGAFTVIEQKRAALRAAELAAWLNKMPFCGLPVKPENVAGADWQSKVKGRTGIIYFADYWARPGEREATASGDHIDLWNRSTLTPSWESLLRFRIGVSRLGNPIGPGNIFSNLDNAKTILFWEIR